MSQWFQFEPYPDDHYEITVKAEIAYLLDQTPDIEVVGQVATYDEETESSYVICVGGTPGHGWLTIPSDEDDDSDAVVITEDPDLVARYNNYAEAKLVFDRLVAAHPTRCFSMAIMDTAPCLDVHVVANKEQVVLDLAQPNVRWQEGPRFYLERRMDHWRCYVHSDADDAKVLVCVNDDKSVGVETF